MNEIFEHGIYEFGQSICFLRSKKKAREQGLMSKDTNQSDHFTLKMYFIKSQAKLLIGAYFIWSFIFLIEIFFKLLKR